MPRWIGVLIAVLAAQTASAQPVGPAPGPAPSPPASAMTPPAARQGSGIGERGESNGDDLAGLNPPMVGDLGRRGYRLLVVPVFQVALVPTLPAVIPPTTGAVVPPQPPPQQPPNTGLPGQPPQPGAGRPGQPAPPAPVVPTLVPVVVANTVVVRLPVVAPALKIAENESPRPLDRVFAGYNFFDGLRGIGSPGFDVHRGTFGFETTFLDGNASVGVRMPVYQSAGGQADIDGFGAASAVLKFALLNDPASGDVLSGGLMVTGLTGRDVRLADGSRLDTFYLQPWVGFIYNMGSAYVHGFSSVLVPTDSRDITFLSNDVGVGYRAYQGGASDVLSSITPTVEAHLFTPLNNQGKDELIQAFDDLVITAGAYFGLAGNRVWLTTAAAFSLCGPRQFDAEFIAQLNWRY